MIENWENSFHHVLQSEGGYVNDPADPGGETNLGVTKAAWAAYIGRPVEHGEMHALTKEMVEPFYKANYWDKCHCDELPIGLDYAVFDFAVNGGVKRAAKFLQQAVGVEADGSIGAGTVAAAQAVSPQDAIEAFSQAKKDFYNGLAEKNPTQQKFLHGWLNRVAQVEQTASAMA
jgi:lysozyme family protein